ncbi:hypothetical protein DL897_02310 [Thermoflavimicrobium daqui]|uniref:Uncharacterized protein n=1 Tax=Thermoflavimicrobium daqui TaxID=2137476 RepID=A0A364K9K9_9BACL|nr:hypothetical protein DL897_02310 [Thermoflavimicrobium daqui]
MEVKEVRIKTASPGIRQAREIYNLALQGKVYGVPFAVGLNEHVFPKEWGAADARIRGVTENGGIFVYYWKRAPSVFFTFLGETRNYEEFTVGVRDVKSTDPYFLNGRYISLPDRYKDVTIQDVIKVFGDNYYQSTYTEPAGSTVSYFYTLSFDYCIRFAVYENKLVSFMVSKQTNPFVQEDLKKLRQQ